jgi:hypothetical protein
MERTVEGPDSVFSTAEEAGAWLGLDEEEMRRETESFPEILRPARIGGEYRFYWMDLVCYAHLRHRLKPGPPEE